MSEGVCKTLLLKGLPSDYKTISTSMSNNTSSNSIQGLLHQHESKLHARQVKKEQAVLFTAVQQSLQQSSLSSLNPCACSSCGGWGQPCSGGGNSKNEEPALTTLAAVKEPTMTKCSRCSMEHGQDRCPKSECSSECTSVTKHNAASGGMGSYTPAPWSMVNSSSSPFIMYFMFPTSPRTFFPSPPSSVRIGRPSSMTPAACSMTNGLPTHLLGDSSQWASFHGAQC